MSLFYRHFQACTPETDNVLKTCVDMLSSEAMFCLVSKLTGMNLSEDRNIALPPAPAPGNSSKDSSEGTVASASATSAEEDADEDMLMCVQNDGDEDDEFGDEEGSNEGDGDESEDDEDEEDGDDNAPLGNPTVQASVRSWSPGCYTLMHDLESQTAGMALDGQLFFEADGEFFSIARTLESS